MKTSILLSILFFVSTITGYSQWTENNGIIYPTTSGAKVGIGNTSPQRILHVDGISRFSSNSDDCMVEILNWNLAGGPNDICFNASNIASTAHAAMVFAGSKFYFHSGNVGIGVSDTEGYKLAVAGSMIAEEVVVKLQSSWPDYVFGSDYQLMPLDELEKFISKNNHLPDIPSKTQIKTSGINVADINTKLLRKIEELTLYVIEIKKENKKLSEKLKNLK